MQFAHPEVLWALSALTIPVLVHLFSFRRHKKVAFSQTAFLKEVRQESRSRNQIRHWLVLLMRLLALTCLVLAFAEPIDESANALASNEAAVSIYVDNSPSMELEGPNGPLLEGAKNGAMTLVESFGPTTRFHVTTSEFAPEDARMLSREEAVERLATLRMGHAAPSVEDALLQQQRALSEAEGSKEAYLFTDLQASSHLIQPVAAGLVDSSLQVRFITQPVQGQVNVRIDSAWFDSPMRLTGRDEVLHVRLTHDATRPVNDLPLSLSINGEQVAIGSYGLTPGLPSDTVLRFRHPMEGHIHATVRTVDAPVRFDDALHLGYEVQDRPQVILVQGKDAGAAEQVALQRLFGHADLHDVRIMDVSSLDYKALNKGDLIVLQGLRNPSSGLVAAVLEGISNGQSVFLLPPPEALGPGWGELLVGLGGGTIGTWTALDNPTRLGRLNDEHPLFQGVFNQKPGRIDLPSVRGWHNRIQPGPRERNLLSFSSGNPFITAGQFGSGRYYWSAAPLDAEWTNLAQHALLVPMALRMAESARSSGIQAFISGRDEDIVLRGASANASDRWTVRAAKDSAKVLLLAAASVPGGHRLTLPLSQLDPGNYEVHLEPAAGAGEDRVVMTFGVNPEPRESDLRVLDPDAWQQAMVTAGWTQTEVVSTDAQDVVAKVESLNDRTPDWIGLIALALLFLLVEMTLLKRKSAGLAHS